MARRLATHVHVRGQDGRLRVFGPDDDLPEWAAKAITSDKAFAEQSPSSGQGQASSAEASREETSSRRSTRRTTKAAEE